jgi:hypothetical protein
MIDYNFAPSTYFPLGETSNELLKLSFPESTWGDELWIEVSTDGEKIYYEASDFYGNSYILIPQESFSPLKLKDVIMMIETIALAAHEAAGNMEMTLIGIPLVESNHYPDLKIYFNKKRKTSGLE